MAASSLLATLPMGPRGRLLAVAMTLVAAGTAWSGVAVPLMAWNEELAETVERRMALVARLEGLATTLPALRGQLAEAGQRPPARTALPGGTDATVAAALQQWLEAVASRHGANLTSVEALPAEPVGAWRRIGLRVAMSGAWPPLVRIFQEIEAAPLTMLADDVQIQAGLALGDGAVQAMDATFTLYGFRVAPTPVVTQ